MKETQAKRFCRCIKSVKKTLKLRPGQRDKEAAAIAICVKSILQSRGRTLKKFNCKKGHPHLSTQKLTRRRRA
jgi:hypothetical protein